jgi:hypothetical protein
MIALWVLILGACGGVILTPRYDDRGRGSYDQRNYHQRVIETFAGELPTPDVSDYLSATTPGYHLVLSAPSAAGVGTRGLRLIGLVFPLAMVGVLAWHVGQRAGWVRAFAVLLPVATSMYVMHSAMWLLPDDAAWFGVACVLVLAFRARVDWLFYVGGGVALAWLVMARQIHAWAAAPLWVAAWLGERDEGNETIRGLFSGVSARLRRAAPAGLATLPGLAILGTFGVVWGGLTPPTFQARYGEPNPATPAFVLSLLAIYSAFFGAYIVPAAIDLLRTRKVLVVLAAVAGLVVCVVPATSFDQDAGRWTGLWRIVAMAPAVGERSVLIVVLGVCGAVALAAWMHALGARARWISLASLVAFTAAQTASHELWQRYSEPFLLMLVAIMSVQVREMPVRSRLLDAGRVVGPAGLGVLLGVVTAASLVSTWGEEPRRLVPLDELQDVIDRVDADSPAASERVD